MAWVERSAGVAALAAVASAMAAGQAGAEAAPTVDELVVTAERTNRALSQVAASVEVVTGVQADETAGAYSTSDIVSRQVNLVAIRPSSSLPVIRGLDGTGPAVGGNAFFAGTRARVNYVVDGRSLTYNEAVYLDATIWDAQQVEVYRGPQSTLQGRNSLAGVVAVKTADPTFTFGGRARVIVGDQNTRQGSIAVGGPLVGDVLAFRLAADYRQERSFVDFAPFDSLYEPIHDPRQSKSWTVRGKLLVKPSDDLRTLLTFSHTDAYAPQAETVTPPFEDFAAAYPLMPRFRTQTNAAIADTDWRVSDKVSVSALFSGAKFLVHRYAALGDGNVLIDGSEYAADVRLKLGRPGDVLSGFIAGYFFDSQQSEEIDIFGGAFDDSTQTRAIFGEATWRPVEKVDLTFGARYEEEERNRTGAGDPIIVDFHDTFTSFLPRATVLYRATPTLTVGATVGRGYNAGGLGIAFSPPFPSEVYGKETVWNYELFLRGRPFDPRLQVSANVFYNDYKGLQLPFDVNPDPAVSALVIRNADRATTYGAELEARFRWLPDLETYAQLGLLKTEVNEYNDPTVQGNDLLRSPAMTFAAGVIYAPARGFGASFDLRYTDAYYSDAFNDPRGKTDPYTLANAQVSYRFANARLFGAVTNIFDKIAVQDLAPGATFAEDVATVTAPRRWTVGLEVAF